MRTLARHGAYAVGGDISGGMRTPFITERFPDVDVGTLQDPQLVATRCSSWSHCPPRRTCPSW
jgi:hypothetical protein